MVASRVGGVPELLTQETGELVPDGDPDALAAGIQRALQRQWAPERLRSSVPFLSWDRFGQTLAGVLSAAVEEQAARKTTVRMPVALPDADAANRI